MQKMMMMIDWKIDTELQLLRKKALERTQIYLQKYIKSCFPSFLIMQITKNNEIMKEFGFFTSLVS